MFYIILIPIIIIDLRRDIATTLEQFIIILIKLIANKENKKLNKYHKPANTSKCVRWAKKNIEKIENVEKSN